MRLAEHVAHTTDYEAMLSGMSHETFNMWCAKDIIEPIGSMQPVCDILAKIGKIIAAFAGHEMDLADFMPWAKKAKKARAQITLTPRQSAVAIQSHLTMLAGGK